MESLGDSYIKKAEQMAEWRYGGGKNDKHFHRSVRQIAKWLWELNEIDAKYKSIKSQPYQNSSDDLAQLDKDRRHIQRKLDARGTSDAIRGKGSSARMH
jgi:hypothetical protein